MMVASMVTRNVHDYVGGRSAVEKFHFNVCLISARHDAKLWISLDTSIVSVGHSLIDIV